MQLFQDYALSHIRPYGPVIENVTNEPAFIAKDPLSIILSGDYNKVPFIIGYNNREGMYLKTRTKTQDGQYTYDIDFETMIPFDLNLQKGSADSLEIVTLMKHFYFGNEELNETNVDNCYMVEYSFNEELLI